MCKNCGSNGNGNSWGSNGGCTNCGSSNSWGSNGGKLPIKNNYFFLLKAVVKIVEAAEMDGILTEVEGVQIADQIQMDGVIKEIHGVVPDVLLVVAVGANKDLIGLSNQNFSRNLQTKNS